MHQQNRPYQQNNPPAPAGPRLVGVATQGFSGPIPPPEILKGYENICPGAAERIIKMAEIEQGHRHGIESKGLKDQTNNERLGMACALLICLVTVIIGAICILNGQPIPGGIATAVPLGIIVVAFTRGTKKIK